MHEYTQPRARSQRAANGVPFIHYGVRLFESADGRIEEGLSQYIFGVLSA